MPAASERRVDLSALIPGKAGPGASLLAWFLPPEASPWSNYRSWVAARLVQLHIMPGPPMGRKGGLGSDDGPGSSRGGAAPRCGLGCPVARLPVEPWATAGVSVVWGGRSRSQEWRHASPVRMGEASPRTSSSGHVVRRNLLDSAAIRQVEMEKDASSEVQSEGPWFTITFPRLV